MTWSFTPDRPIYLQLQEQINLSIVSGLYPPGSKLPAVRDLALEASVNPNTLQRALAELEREGLVYTHRTSGKYVTQDTAVIEKTKNNLAMELVETFLKKMEAVGYSVSETSVLIAEKAEAADAASQTGKTEIEDANCENADIERTGDKDGNS